MKIWFKCHLAIIRTLGLSADTINAKKQQKKQKNSVLIKAENRNLKYLSFWNYDIIIDIFYTTCICNPKYTAKRNNEWTII